MCRLPTEQSSADRSLLSTTITHRQTRSISRRKVLHSRTTRCRPPPSQSRCGRRRCVRRRATCAPAAETRLPAASPARTRSPPASAPAARPRGRTAARGRTRASAAASWRTRTRTAIRDNEAERRRHDINNGRPLPRVDRNVVASRYDSRLRELEREVHALRAERDIAMRRTPDRRPPPRELRRDERERYAVSQRPPRRAARERYSDEN